MAMSNKYVRITTIYTAVQWKGNNINEIREVFVGVLVDFTQRGDYLEMTDRRRGMPSSTNITRGEYIVLGSDNTLSVYNAQNFEASFEFKKGE